jgi:hypothetical protein
MASPRSRRRSRSPVAADFRGEFGSGSMFYSGTGSVKYGW